MARRMGKAADDQYMGGGTGNWSRAPKKKTVAKRKPSGASRRTSEAVKEMKQSKSSVPKPRRKPTNETREGVKSGATYGNPKSKVAAKKSAKSGATYGDPKTKVKRKPQSRSGEMVLSGGPNNAQAAKYSQSQKPKTTVKAKTKTRYERRKTSSAKNSAVGNWFRRNFGTESMRKK